MSSFFMTHQVSEQGSLICTLITGIYNPGVFGLDLMGKHCSSLSRAEVTGLTSLLVVFIPVFLLLCNKRIAFIEEYTLLWYFNGYV